MFPSLYILTLLSQFTASPKPVELDRATVQQAGEQGQISWEDAEDKVTGSFTPWAIQEGQQLDVVARVGNLQGTPFEGPVTFSLTPQKGQAPESVTVKMSPEPRAWAVKLTAGEAGKYWLEIGYTTTRRKVVRAEVTVHEAKLPRWPWWVLTGVVGALALGLGVRAVIGKKT